MKILKVISLSIILLICSSQNILACRCEIMPPPPCYDYWQYDAVFVGTVKEDSLNIENGIPKVEIEVDKNYRGMKNETAYTYNYEHSCALGFEKGEKFLFYGNVDKKDDSIFGTGLCTRTSHFSEKLIDFDFFDSLNSATPNYWIWGTISKGSDTPLEGIKAEVLDNKKKITGVSDKDGNLKISVSKEGKYRVRVQIPNGVFINIPRKEQIKNFKRAILRNKKHYLEYEIEVKNNKCGWFDAALL